MDLHHPEQGKVSVGAAKVAESMKIGKPRRNSSSSDEEAKPKVTTATQQVQLSEAFQNLSTKQGSKASSNSFSSSSFSNQEFKSFTSSGSSQFVGKKVESSFQRSSKSGVQVTQRVVSTSSSSSSKSSSATREELFVASSGGHHHEVLKIENWCGTKTAKTPEQIRKQNEVAVEKIVKKEISKKDAREEKKEIRKTEKLGEQVGKIKTKLKKPGSRSSSSSSSSSSSDSEEEK
ncbi:Hypothetical predicted protein [Cloeon dipterum]|uniref:Uncharacterized protein n=1 Tax=Cloeon dipterum TaxID=197152 RepID=A0A8S1C3L0_9INSE|nr:Hypothetical predicted protein [Cloeon dipterum]